MQVPLSTSTAQANVADYHVRLHGGDMEAHWHAQLAYLFLHFIPYGSSQEFFSWVSVEHCHVFFSLVDILPARDQYAGLGH
jgi:hypothetical protein